MRRKALSRDTGRWWGPPLRACGVVVAFAGTAAAVVALGIKPLTTLDAELDRGVAWAALPLDLLLDCMAAVALAGCGLWLAAVAVATVVEAMTGASSAAIRAVSPHVVRRLVLVCCGVAVGGSSVLSPAMAVDDLPGATPGTPAERTTAVAGSHDAPPAAPSVVLPDTTSRAVDDASDVSGALSGLPLPDRAVGEASTQTEQRQASSESRPPRTASPEPPSPEPPSPEPAQTEQRAPLSEQRPPRTATPRPSASEARPARPEQSAAQLHAAGNARAAKVTDTHSPSAGHATNGSPASGRPSDGSPASGRPSGRYGDGRSTDGVHRVRAGESLWSIAERLLPRADAAGLDAAWRRIYRRNRHEIGPNPDLVLTGTSLRLPPATRAVLDPPDADPGDDHHRKDAS
jgi:hypothetical protein